jgi:ornithine carbamoyltransferase
MLVIKKKKKEKKDALQKHTRSIFPGSSLEMRLSVEISAEKQGWEKNMVAVN